MNRTARRRSRDAEFRLALHELNQRYRAEWERAERLEDELVHIKNSRAYRILSWWRCLTELWRWRRSITNQTAEPIEIIEHRAAPSGAVSILIPFKDRPEFLRNCIRSLRRGTYRDVEVILLDNDSVCRRTLRLVRRACGRVGVRAVACPGPFNFARIANFGARHARGDYLLFLNNDVEVIAPDWLERLLEFGGCPEIGIVGATLLYPDATLQHAGIFPVANGEWGHVYRGRPHDFAGDAGELRHARAVPAVTGACLMIRRDLFTRLNGFDENYPLAFNDVDLCCRVRRLGLKVAITPEARLLHYESLSRGYCREFLHGFHADR